MIISPCSRAEVVLVEVGWWMAVGHRCRCCWKSRNHRNNPNDSRSEEEREREGGREGGREREQPAGAGQTTCVMMPSADEDGFLVPALPLDPLVTGFEEVVP